MTEARTRGAMMEILRQRRHEPVVDSQYIVKNEGVRLKPYKDPKGNWTIGVGHKIVPETPRIFKQLFGKNTNVTAILSGKQSLTKKQANLLFEYDIVKRLPELQRTFPRYDTYPRYLRTALMDGWFRGDLPASPRTIEFIRNGDFATASMEYINHDEYRKSVENQTGVHKRMDRNAAMMLKFAKDPYEQYIQAKLEQP